MSNCGIVTQDDGKMEEGNTNKNLFVIGSYATRIQVTQDPPTTRIELTAETGIQVKEWHGTSNQTRISIS